MKSLVRVTSVKYNKRLPVIALLHLGQNIGSLVDVFSKIVTRITP